MAKLNLPRATTFEVRPLSKEKEAMLARLAEFHRQVSEVVRGWCEQFPTEPEKVLQEMQCVGEWLRRKEFSKPQIIALGEPQWSLQLRTKMERILSKRLGYVVSTDPLPPSLCWKIWRAGPR